jgi:hypothetical protein
MVPATFRGPQRSRGVGTPRTAVESLRDRLVPDTRLLWRERGEVFKDWLGVPTPHLRHNPCVSVVMDGALHEPAAWVALRVGEGECLTQFRPSERAVYGAELRRG